MRLMLETSVLAAWALAAVLLLTAPAVAQVVRPDPATASTRGQTDTVQTGPTVPGERIERMLAQMSSDRDPRLRSLNLREYVIVVGQRPVVPLLGADPDLTSGAPGYGAPTHIEMLAALTPSDIQQAAGSDARGIATAALSMLALTELAGWFAGDDGQTPLGPRYAGYTGSFRLDRDASDRSAQVSVVPFYRTEGQPVTLSATFDPDPAGGVLMTVDDQPFGVFDRDVNDLPIPEALLAQERQGDVHLLKLTRPTDTTQDDPVQIDVVVVVRERDDTVP